MQPSENVGAQINLANVAYSETSVAASRHPDQDKEGYADLYQSLCNHTAMVDAAASSSYRLELTQADQPCRELLQQSYVLAVANLLYLR